MLSLYGFLKKNLELQGKLPDKWRDDLASIVSIPSSQVNSDGVLSSDAMQVSSDGILSIGK